MGRITESAIEKFAVELLEKSGYQYIYAPNIGPGPACTERSTRLCVPARRQEAGRKQDNMRNI